MERGGRRSGDAGSRVRVADGAAGAATHRRLLHAVRARRDGRRRRASTRRSAVAPRELSSRHCACSIPRADRARFSCTRSSASPARSRTRATRATPTARRRAVLTRSIYGVDLNPTAVWLCELRLWLSVVIESDERDPAAVLPLPNLDRNIRVGDALSGRAFGADDARVPGAHVAAPSARAIRRRERRAEGLARASARARGARSRDRDRCVPSSRRSRRVGATCSWRGAAATCSADDIGRRSTSAPRPPRFDVTRRRFARWSDVSAPAALFPSRFPCISPTSPRAADSMSSSGIRRGCGCIAFPSSSARTCVATTKSHARPRGNRAPRRPPRVARSPRRSTSRRCSSSDRSSCLAPGGVLSLLLPVKLWRSLAGGGVRRLLASETDVRRIVDFSEAPAAFDAAVYPSLLVTTRRPPTADARPNADRRRRAPSRQRAARVAHVGRGARTRREPTARRGSSFRRRRATRSIVCDAPGRMLAQSPVGRPHLGVKCGCNDAFVVELVARSGELAEVRARDGRRGTVERRAAAAARSRRAPVAMERVAGRGAHPVDARRERCAAREPSAARAPLARAVATRALGAHGRARTPRDGGRSFAPRAREPTVRASSGRTSDASRAHPCSRRATPPSR